MPYHIVRVYPKQAEPDREMTMSQHFTKWMARRHLKSWKRYENFGMRHEIRRGW